MWQMIKIFEISQSFEPKSQDCETKSQNSAKKQSYQLKSQILRQVKVLRFKVMTQKNQIWKTKFWCHVKILSKKVKVITLQGNFWD